MRLLAALLIATAPIALTLSIQAQSKPADILNAETKFWLAYVAGDSAALTRQFAPDFLNIEQQIQTGPQVADFAQTFHSQCSLAPVKILDPRITFPSPTIATIVYHATETVTCAGKTMGGNTNITTVWVLQDGQWRMHLHTEYADTSH